MPLHHSPGNATCQPAPCPTQDTALAALASSLAHAAWPWPITVFTAVLSNQFLRRAGAFRGTQTYTTCNARPCPWPVSAAKSRAALTHGPACCPSCVYTMPGSRSSACSALAHARLVVLVYNGCLQRRAPATRLPACLPACGVCQGAALSKDTEETRRPSHNPSQLQPCLQHMDCVTSTTPKDDASP